jgi:flagellar basal-body rod modification protein FlgD
MRINSLPAELTDSSRVTTQGGSGQDQFLRLFLTQLQNQDPLAPQDSAAFVSQLAQFASVEQLAQANQRLELLEASAASSSRAGLTDLVGRTVTASADSFSLSSNTLEPPPLFVQLDSPAKEIEVSILDSSGNVVKKITVDSASSGDLDLHWDGTGENGAKLPPGDYTVQVTAKNSSGAPLTANPIIKGLISSLDLSDGTALFLIGGALVTPGAVETVLNDSE